MKSFLLFAGISFLSLIAVAQSKPEETEIYTPVPRIVTPGASFSDAPSDAIVLFDGRNLDQWVNTKDSTAAKWVLSDNAMLISQNAVEPSRVTKPQPPPADLPDRFASLSTLRQSFAITARSWSPSAPPGRNRRRDGLAGPARIHFP